MMVRRLRQLRGIGDNAAWLYVMELFAWRRFRNRREVGGSPGVGGHAVQEWRPRS